MTSEEKIIEILDKHFGYHVTQGSDEWYTRNYQNRFADLQEMAEWKDEQFSILIKKCNEAVNESHESGAVWMKERLIEKAVKWLEDNQSAYREYDESGFYHEKSQHFIEDFKKAMEE